MTKKIWGLLFLICINNSIDASIFQDKFKKNLKEYTQEGKLFAKSALYATELIAGLFCIGLITEEAIDTKCIYDKRIAYGGYAFVGSSFLYHGCKGIYDMVQENKKRPAQNAKTSDETRATPGISKKILKLLYHGTEIFIASGFLYDGARESAKNCLPKCAANFPPMGIAAILLANGLHGINKELAISAHIQKIINSINKKKQNVAK